MRGPFLWKRARSLVAELLAMPELSTGGAAALITSARQQRLCSVRFEFKNGISVN